MHGVCLARSRCTAPREVSQEALRDQMQNTGSCCRAAGYQVSCSESGAAGGGSGGGGGEERERAEEGAGIRGEWQLDVPAPSAPSTRDPAFRLQVSSIHRKAAAAQDAARRLCCVKAAAVVNRRAP